MRNAAIYSETPSMTAPPVGDPYNHTVTQSSEGQGSDEGHTWIHKHNIQLDLILIPIIFIIIYVIYIIVKTRSWCDDDARGWAFEEAKEPIFNTRYSTTTDIGVSDEIEAGPPINDAITSGETQSSDTAKPETPNLMTYPKSECICQQPSTSNVTFGN